MSEGVICDVWREGHLDDDQVIRCDQPGHPRVTNHRGGSGGKQEKMKVLGNIFGSLVPANKFW